ncbi:hypothetical protein A3Q56_06810, partial [Intoshia linei]
FHLIFFKTKLNHQEQILILKLHEEEKSLREIGKQVGRPYTTISKTLKRLRENKINEISGRTGRRRLSDIRDDRNFIRLHQITSNEFIPKKTMDRR